MGRMLNSREASARIGLAVQTLARFRVEGVGPPFRKIGSRVAYPEEALEAWLAERPLQQRTRGRPAPEAK